jgi:hypothetical protein
MGRINSSKSRLLAGPCECKEFTAAFAAVEEPRRDDWYEEGGTGESLINSGAPLIAPLNALAIHEYGQLFACDQLILRSQLIG